MLRTPSIPDFTESSVFSNHSSSRHNRRSLSPSACQRALYSPVLPTLSPWRLRECRLGNQSSQPSVLSDGISVYSEYSELLCEPLRGVVLSSGLRITPMKKRPIHEYEWTSRRFDSDTDSEVDDEDEDDENSSDDITPNSLSPNSSSPKLSTSTCPMDLGNFNKNNNSSSTQPTWRSSSGAYGKLNSEVAKLLGGVSDLRKCCNPKRLETLSVQQLLVLANELHSHINALNEDLMSQLLLRDDLHLEQGARLIDVEDMSRRAQEAAKILLHSDQQHTVNHQGVALTAKSILPSTKINFTAGVGAAVGSSSASSSSSSQTVVVNVVKKSRLSLWGQPHHKIASFFSRRN